MHTSADRVVGEELALATGVGTLSDVDVARVEEAVLAPSRDGRVLWQRTFVTRLRRAVASVDNLHSKHRLQRGPRSDPAGSF